MVDKGAFGSACLNESIIHLTAQRHNECGAWLHHICFVLAGRFHANGIEAVPLFLYAGAGIVIVAVAAGDISVGIHRQLRHGQTIAGRLCLHGELDHTDILRQPIDDLHIGHIGH